MSLLKLLVIEDEQSLLRSILEYFRQEDFLCEGVETYREGIRKIEDYQYNCIILDINLMSRSSRFRR
jgi:DNA-binding response OmpR family regulator